MKRMINYKLVIMVFVTSSCMPITHGVSKVSCITRSKFDGMVLIETNYGAHFNVPDGMYTIGDTIYFSNKEIH